MATKFVVSILDNKFYKKLCTQNDLRPLVILGI